MTSGNEGKCCDAVIRVLEQSLGCARERLRLPERDGVGPPVEARLWLGGREYAIEHTVIEAHDKQIAMDAIFDRFGRPIETRLSGKLKAPGIYELVLPTDVTLEASPKQIGPLIDVVAKWVDEQAEELVRERPARRTRDEEPYGFSHGRGRTFPGLGFDLMLVRRVHWSDDPKHDGKLFTARFSPAELERRRQERMRAALDRKLPKLQLCEQEGAATVLVLEMRDIALSNHVLIGQALEAELEGRSDQPEVVYLVDTTIPTWTARALFRRGVGFVTNAGPISQSRV